MPILDLQKRARELGRIRIGQQVAATKRNGEPTTRPAKLDKFRLTSASRPLLDKVAAAYGGTVREWTPANGGVQQWEVYTDADRLPILVPPQAVTQWYELWSGGGCKRRCDGEQEILSDQPCLCAQDDERQCKPTTRLNVVLRDVEGIGVFRLESHGYYAAVELPNVAAFLEQAGGYVSAWLVLEARTVKRDGEQPRHFMVPAIEIEGVTPGQLIAGQVIRPEVGAGAAPAPVHGARPAIAAAAEPAPVDHERDAAYIDRALRTRTADEVRDIYKEAVAAGHMHETLAQQLTTIGKTKSQKPAAQPSSGDPTQAATWLARAKICQTLDELTAALAEAQQNGFAMTQDEVAAAFFARRDQLAGPAQAPPSPAPPGPDPAALWGQIVTEAGTRGFDRTADVEAAFARRWDGDAPAQASASQLETFLAELRAGKVRPPQAAAAKQPEPAAAAPASTPALDAPPF